MTESDHVQEAHTLQRELINNKDREYVTEFIGKEAVTHLDDIGAVLKIDVFHIDEAPHLKKVFERLRGDRHNSYIIEYGGREIVIDLKKMKDGSKRVEPMFYFIESLENKARELDELPWHKIKKRDKKTDIFQVETGDLLQPPDKDSIDFMLDMAHFIKKIDSNCRVVLDPSDKRREKIYWRTFKENPNVEVLEV